MNCIELDKNDSLETVYIGTDLGVFTSDSTLNDWNQFNNNSLPNVIVNELEIQYQSNKLFAATYGRGLWNIDLQITSHQLLISRIAILFFVMSLLMFYS